MKSPKIGFRIAFGFMLLPAFVIFTSSLALAAGSISGTVLKASDSLAIEGVTVNAYDSNWNLTASRHQ